MQVLHICVLCHVLNIVVKYYCRSTIKQHTTAIYSHHHTVICPEFWSTALLWYGGHPYNTVFCTAITVYGMVENPSKMVTFAVVNVNMVEAIGMDNSEFVIPVVGVRTGFSRRMSQEAYVSQGGRFKVTVVPFL